MEKETELYLIKRVIELEDMIRNITLENCELRHKLASYNERTINKGEK